MSCKLLKTAVGKWYMYWENEIGILPFILLLNEMNVVLCVANLMNVLRTACIIMIAQYNVCRHFIKRVHFACLDDIGR